MWLIGLEFRKYLHSKTLYGLLLIAVLYTVSFFSDPDKVLTPEMVVGNYTFFMALFGGILIAFHATEIPREPLVLSKPVRRFSALLQHFGAVALLSVLFSVIAMPIEWHYYPNAHAVELSAVVLILFLLGVSAFSLLPAIFLGRELRILWSVGVVFLFLGAMAGISSPNLAEKLLLPVLSLSDAFLDGTLSYSDALTAIASVGIYVAISVAVFGKKDLR
ncbi:hypothetical protein [Thermococcus sp. JdF3]|uniref:hypothetical protein n=1 Tax=Thermococcus sp. JdF3 TaxID=1638258 RepID=UPI00143A2B38|nr:hypothetical protein [Thermococcus sp. JdF3]NJE00300.1 hypothetical protein [Thermococcus sp. JdF3]